MKKEISNRKIGADRQNHQYQALRGSEMKTDLQPTPMNCLGFLMVPLKGNSKRRSYPDGG